MVHNESRPRNLPANQRRALTVEAVIELTAEQNPGDITKVLAGLRSSECSSETRSVFDESYSSVTNLFSF